MNLKSTNEMTDRADTDPKLILFDGVCNLCNGFVDFVIRRDPNKQFRFGTLQSEIGQATLKKHGMGTTDFDTVLLVEGDKVWTKSSAALRVLRQLSGAWPLTYAFMLVPRIIRDAVYSLIGNNRYRIFGKSSSCRVPTAEEMDRFV
jgi:predicted DCC family thiol-disulfide oxidoreductase YuxK